MKNATTVLAAGEAPSALPDDSRDARKAPPTRFAVIDCYKFTRDCLVRLIEELYADIEVVQFDDLADYLDMLPEHVTLAIYYSHATDLTGARIQHDISETKAALGDVPLIMMSDAGEAQRPHAIRIALGSGARGYIPTRTAGIDIVFAVIRFVKAGGTFAPIGMEPDGRPQEDAAIVQLRLNGNMTSRQLEVLALLKEGKANKIIAHQLGMSESTVKAHVRNIMRMMGVRNRTQVACSTQDWGTMQGGGL